MKKIFMRKHDITIRTYIYLFFAGTSVPLSEFSLPQSVADKIGKLVLDKFTEKIVGQASQHR